MEVGGPDDAVASEGRRTLLSEVLRFSAQIRGEGACGLPPPFLLTPDGKSHLLSPGQGRIIEMLVFGREVRNWLKFRKLPASVLRFLHGFEIEIGGMKF